MGVRAPQKLALAHSRNDKIGDVFGSARDLIDAIDALDRATDNRKLALFLSHDVRPSCGRKISVYEASKQLHTLRITAISLLSSRLRLLPRRLRDLLEAVPLLNPAPHGSIARTAGLGVAQVRSTLDELEQRRLVERFPTGWRLAEAADQG